MELPLSHDGASELTRNVSPVGVQVAKPLTLISHAFVRGLLDGSPLRCDEVSAAA